VLVLDQGVPPQAWRGDRWGAGLRMIRGQGFGGPRGLALGPPRRL